MFLYLDEFWTKCIFYSKIQVLENTIFYFWQKFPLHKNSPKCLKFMLKFFTQVYISMKNDKTIFCGFLEDL